MKHFLLLFAILFIGSSFKPTNQTQNFDFQFLEDDVALTEKSYQQLLEVEKYVQQFETFNLNIEVPPADDEELIRARLDELLLELENLDLSVEQILFYSSSEYLSDDLKKLASKNEIRLIVNEVIIQDLITSTTNIDKNTTSEKKKTVETQMPKWAKPVVNYNNNIKRFNIDNHASSKLKLADGSTIEIEAESFVFQDGSAVSSPIEIETKFANTKNIAILEELTTTFGNDILESRGMIYVNATADNQQLKLAEGKEIAINVKTKGVEDGFQAFQGIRNTRNGNMDWLLDDEIVKLRRKRGKYKYYKYEKISSEKQAEFISFRNDKIQYWEEKGVDKKKIKQRLKAAKKYARKRERRRKKSYKDPTRKRYTNNYEKKRLRRKDFDLWRRSAKSNPNRRSTRYKIGIPKYEYVEYEKKIDPRFPNTFYNMRSRSLGWHNIDQLFRLPRLNNQVIPPCNLIVKASSDENIKVVFNDFFVVLKGEPHPDGFIFKNLPRDIRVTILSAKKLENGNIKIAKIRTKTSDRTISLSNYTKISSEEFVLLVEELDV